MALTPYRYKIGMFLNEVRTFTLDQALALAQDTGCEYVWYTLLAGEPDFAEATDKQIASAMNRLKAHKLKLWMIGTGVTFKQVHLTDLDLAGMQDNPLLKKEFDDLLKCMDAAVKTGCNTVMTYSFAWPGEYTAAKPTWPMRWLTRGGIISELDMDKLTKAFSLVAEAAEKRNVDVVVGMMPWNYTSNTTNMRALMERVKSKRLKVMWGPADNINSGEIDAVSASFLNVKPYINSIHIKDLRVVDGYHNKFDYCPIGDGQVDFPSVLRSLRDNNIQAMLSISTHFLPPGGSKEEAMRLNMSRIQALTKQIESEKTVGAARG
ncbi:MAG: sugar phosphate isomerase/epimerase [SAR202 cluster bacterium]|nr:sugar phosphate isomerase/epimerase [SAR202 cluster bacterium]